MGFGRFILDVDVERTRAFYQSAPGIGCDCAGCRNYSSAVGTLPAQAQTFFQSLGIEPKKPAEVYVNCTNEDGTLWYGGFYHLCGTLVQGQGGWRTVAATPNATTSAWERETCCPVTEHFLVAFTEDTALLEDNFPTPVLQMEIDISLPWTLEEPNPY